MSRRDLSELADAVRRLRFRYELDDCAIDLAWSPRGERLAAASISGPIAVLDGSAGTPTVELRGHSFGTLRIAWQPGSARLASAGQDGLARIWEVGRRAECHALDAGAAWVEQLAWSDDGQLLATAAGREIRIWTPAGCLVSALREPASTVAALAWQPGGHVLASGAYGGIRLWRPDAEQPVEYLAWQGSVLAIAWSPDGRRIVSGNQDASVHYWDLVSGTDLHMWGYLTKVRALAWDANGRWLATGGGPTIVVWDCAGAGPENSTPLQLAPSQDPVTALAFQRGGPLLASGSADGTVCVWSPGRRRSPRLRVRVGAAVACLRWAPDGSRLAIGDEAGAVSVLSAAR